MFIQFQAEYFLNAYHVLSENNKTISKSLENTQEKSHIGVNAVGPRLTMGDEKKKGTDLFNFTENKSVPINP